MNVSLYHLFMKAYIACEQTVFYPCQITLPPETKEIFYVVNNTFLGECLFHYLSKLISSIQIASLSV